MWLKQRVGLRLKRPRHLLDGFQGNRSGALPDVGDNVRWRPERSFVFDCSWPAPVRLRTYADDRSRCAPEARPNDAERRFGSDAASRQSCCEGQITAKSSRTPVTAFRKPMVRRNMTVHSSFVRRVLDLCLD